MKLYKSLLIASAIIGGMMTSCSDDGYWDKASGMDQGFLDNGKTYTFNSATTNYTFGPYDDMSGEVFEIPVMRNNTSGTVTLPIKVELSSDSLLISEESVTFEDGANTAYLKMVPVRDFEIGEKSTATLIIDTAAVDIPYVAFPDSTLIKKENSTEADTTEFKRQEAAYETYIRELSIYKLVNKVTVAKEYSWKSLGNATYREDFMTTLYDIDNLVYQVEILECEQVPGYYRLVNPYGEAFGYNEDGDWDKDNNYYLEIHAEDSTKVWIDESPSGMDWGSGEFYMWSFAGMYLAAGRTLDQVAASGYCGSLVDGIITFPERTLLIGRGTSLWYANLNSMFAVALPGYSIKDFSAEVLYSGLFINPAEEQYVLADVTLGPDVDHAWITVVPGKDNVEDAYSLIADGTITAFDEEVGYTGAMQYVTVTEDGQYQVPMMADAASGRYTIVIFTFDEEGNVIDAYQDYNYATFSYTGASESPEVWEPAFVGDYVYTLWFADMDEEGNVTPATDEGLTLYQSDKGRYKIEHWGYDVDFIFTMDEETGTLTVEEQETGDALEELGPVYVSTYDDYLGSDYDPETQRSYYEEGVFHFNLVYHVAQGALKGGYGEEETFTLTGKVESEPSSIAPWNAKKPGNAKKVSISKFGKSKVRFHRNANLPIRFR